MDRSEGTGVTRTIDQPLALLRRDADSKHAGDRAYVTIMSTLFVFQAR